MDSTNQFHELFENFSFRKQKEKNRFSDFSFGYDKYFSKSSLLRHIYHNNLLKIINWTYELVKQTKKWVDNNLFEVVFYNLAESIISLSWKVCRRRCLRSHREYIYSRSAWTDELMSIYVKTGQIDQLI